jgi:hemerythrin
MSEELQNKRAPYVVEWRDAFKVNINQVDEEHHRLFDIIRSLDISTVDNVITELLDYVVTHFTNEQALMEQSGYPAFEQHLKLHEEFGAHVAEFLGSGDEWTEERVHDLRRFLNKWLIGHIMTHDLRFGRWYGDHHGKGPVAAVQAKPEQRGFFARLFGRG